MRKILIFLLIFSCFSLQPISAVSIKKDYKNKFLREAKSAERRHDDKAAFHLYEKAIYYYPRDINILLSYAEFCEKNKYYAKASELYSLVYTMTNDANHLYHKYLSILSNGEVSAEQIKSINSDKRFSRHQKINFYNLEIAAFGGTKNIKEINTVCSYLKMSELNKSTANKCALASEKLGNKNIALKYYLRAHEIEPRDVEHVKKVLSIAEEKNDAKLQEEFIKKFISINPKDKGLKDKLGGFYIKNKRFHEASTVYEALMASGELNEHIKNNYAYSMYMLNPKGKFKNPYLLPKKEATSQTANESSGNENQKISQDSNKYSKRIVFKPKPPSKEDIMYSYLRKKQYLNAQKLLDELLDEKPENLKLIRLRADVALEQKDYSNAAKYLSLYKNKVGRLSKQDSRTLAYAYAELGDLNSSVNLLEELFQENKSDKELLESIIGYSMELKDWDRALKYVNIGLMSSPHSEELLRAQGDLYSAKKDFSNAVASYEKLVKIYPKKDYIITLTGLYLATNEFAKAENIISQLYSQDKNDTKVSSLYLSSLMANQKTYKAYNVAKESELLDTRDGYLVQGDVSMELKMYSDAQCFYSKARDLDPKDEIINVKLADSLRSQKQFFDAEKIYKSVLDDKSDSKMAQMGLGYLEMDRKRFANSRSEFCKVLGRNPDDQDAKKGYVYSYIANADNIMALREMKGMPVDDDLAYTRGQTYYDMSMFSNAQDSIKGVFSPESRKLLQKTRRERAWIIQPNYMFLNQQLSDSFDLDANKVGVLSSKYVGNNINIFTDYNMYIYSSGAIQNGHKLNNVTNEFRVGAEGRPLPKFAFRGDLGGKFYQEFGEMLITDSWVKYYPNDRLNFKLGFKRNNLEQSYVSAVGAFIDGVYTGQVPDNKAYLEYEARHKTRFYSFGRAAVGVMGGKNLVANPYTEAMLGGGCVIYDNKENKFLKKANFDLVSYNSHYSHDLLDLYSNNGKLYGGYWSPQFFSANTANLKLEGNTKNEKLFYGVRGFVGSQLAYDPYINDTAFGVSVFVLLNMNDHAAFRAEYNYYNYAQLRKDQVFVSFILRGFKSVKN